ncbi:MAG: CDP-diacylglycerol--glycerol-3-phosphate 3-phosphatidyltransferase [Halobacteriovoraceae bacterium]|nr:CDP-diacylglycerol--glycerol-3-phosphate 3-phosphatidyltransferase [Halobacteriovoraceae bacterium]|tara:strand:+ start:11922 stop:12581 length:660 start_codon:yes stop_codon:yes gene_type:complete
MEKPPETDDLQIDNLPNRLTTFRIALIPVVMILLYFTHPNSKLAESTQSILGWTAAWIFALAAITDFFDGYIARRRNIVTVFGSFLDPIADKFLTVSSLIMLQYLERLHAFIVIVLVLREMYMTSLRLLATNEGIAVPVNQLGKWKTATMMVGIPFIMANESWSLLPWLPLPEFGHALVYIAAILSLGSAIIYTLSMIQKLKADRALKRKQRKLQKQNI